MQRKTFITKSKLKWKSLNKTCDPKNSNFENGFLVDMKCVYERQGTTMHVKIVEIASYTRFTWNRLYFVNNEVIVG